MQKEITYIDSPQTALFCSVQLKVTIKNVKEMNSLKIQEVIFNIFCKH